MGPTERRRQGVPHRTPRTVRRTALEPRRHGPRPVRRVRHDRGRRRPPRARAADVRSLLGHGGMGGVGRMTEWETKKQHAYARAAAALTHAADRIEKGEGPLDLVVDEEAVNQCGGPADNTRLGRTLPRNRFRTAWAETMTAINDAHREAGIGASWQRLPADFRGVAVLRHMSEWAAARAARRQETS